MSLERYSGPWTFQKAAHLLRRTTFGPDKSHITQAVDMGLDATIASLLAVQQMPAPPVNFHASIDATTPVGETWVSSTHNVQGNNGRNLSLAGWTIEQMMSNRMSVVEKMVLFWHNHFAIADGNPDARYNYKYISTIRKNAVGDFKQLTKDITIDPLMLRYLNGRENAVGSPNENYARELLELFTVGKGAIVGSGDYSTFTEVDVIEIAKVLTGWRDIGYKNVTVAEVASSYRNFRHDKTTKTLSHRFGNAVIPNMAEEEYAHLIDVIFESPHVAEHICRKLYRWFVYYDIPDEIEQTIILPMAQILRDSDYQLMPVLEALLASEHFLGDDHIGCMIKSPIDFIMSMTNGFGTPTSEELLIKYYSNVVVFRYISDLQMTIYNLPSVAGWKAYYQNPGYYQIWINSVTLPLRKQASDGLGSSTDVALAGIDRPLPIGIDALAQLDNVSDPYDINKVVREIADIHLPRKLSDEQYEMLKNTVLNGLPDFEWSVEYGQYIAEPTDDDYRRAVENKVRSLIVVMMSMPEFQLM